MSETTLTMKTLRTLLACGTILALSASSLIAAGSHIPTRAAGSPTALAACPATGGFTFTHSPSLASTRGAGALDHTSIRVLLLTALAAIAVVRVAERRKRQRQDR